MPTYDFVIVDDRVVARMQFGPAFIGAELLDDQDALDKHRAWRTLAWHHATTINTHTSRSP